MVCSLMSWRRPWLSKARVIGTALSVLVVGAQLLVGMHERDRTSRGIRLN